MSNLNATQKLLVATAWIDGQLDDREAHFVRRILANGMVSVDEIEACLRHPIFLLDEVLAELPASIPPADVLREVLKMCFADDILEADEFELIQRLSQHLGVNEDQLEELRLEVSTAS